MLICVVFERNLSLPSISIFHLFCSRLAILAARSVDRFCSLQLLGGWGRIMSGMEDLFSIILSVDWFVVGLIKFAILKCKRQTLVVDVGSYFKLSSRSHAFHRSWSSFILKAVKRHTSSISGFATRNSTDNAIQLLKRFRWIVFFPV